MAATARHLHRGAAVVCAWWVLLVASGCLQPAERPVVEAENGFVRVDPGPIAPGDGRFYTYRSPGGARADFILYRESDGEPRVVLDACTECYRWGKGYRLETGAVVCVKCGMRFSFDSLRTGVGGCNPVKLPSRQQGGRIEIPAAALDEGTRYFRQ